MASGDRIDPDLTPESRMRRMREEMFRLRRAVLSLVPDKYRALVEPPYDFTRETSLGWERRAVERILEIVPVDNQGRAPCPLCGMTTQFYGVGFVVPGGLERHLLGSHKSHQCDVMHAASGLLRVMHRKAYPDDYGPYGCD